VVGLGAHLTGATPAIRDADLGRDPARDKTTIMNADAAGMNINLYMYFMLSLKWVDLVSVIFSGVEAGERETEYRLIS